MRSFWVDETLATDRPYIHPSKIKNLIRNLGTDQWLALQFYRFRTYKDTSDAAAWDCTSADEFDHFTKPAEDYCWVDFMEIIDHIKLKSDGSVGVVARIRDPAAVACAWGPSPRIKEPTLCT